MTRLRDMLAVVVVGALVFAFVPLLHPFTEDTLAASWLAAASGAERVPPGAHLSVWHGRSGAVAPEPAFALAVARIFGGGLAETSLATVIVVLALVWGFAAAHVAKACHAPWLVVRFVVLACALGALAISDGRWSVLAAAPLASLVAELVTKPRALRIVVAVAALAMLSQGGLAIAVLALAVAALGRGANRDESVRGLWLAAALAVAALVVFDEPRWAHVLRFSAPHAFGPSGAWAPETTPLSGTWVLFGDRAPAIVAAILLLAGAVVGAARVPATHAAAIAAIAFGSLRLASPHRFATLLLPPALFHPIAAIATAVVVVLLIALFAAANRRSVVAIIGLALVVLGFVARPRGTEMPALAPSAPPEILETRVGRGIVLPLSPATALEWRRVAGAGEGIANGLQAVLDRNPGLLATELPLLDRDELAKALERLDLDWALTADGIVFARGGARGRKREGCLPPEGWSFASTRGHRDVSVPERAVDGDPRTRWGTGGPQKPGDFFALELPTARALASIELDYSAFPADRPRGFRVLVAGREGEPREWFARDPYVGEVAWSEDGFPHFESDRKRKIRIPLGGRQLKKIVVELTRPARRVDWSIGEICLRPEPADVRELAARAR